MGVVKAPVCNHENMRTPCHWLRHACLDGPVQRSNKVAYFLHLSSCNSCAWHAWKRTRAREARCARINVMEPLWRVGRADGAVRSAGRTPNALDGSSVDDSCSCTGGDIPRGRGPRPPHAPPFSCPAPPGLQEPGGPHVASIVQQCLTVALGSLVL
jgi:hypothetical protein